MRKPLILKLEKGNVKGEDLYVAFGNTNAGRHLTILFVKKKNSRALVISARDMSKKERKRYGKNKSKHFNTYEEAAEWFNSQNMTDFKDQLKPVDFNFDLRKNRNWVELEREIAVHLRKIAIEKKIPTRILVNKMLKERLQELR